MQVGPLLHLVPAPQRGHLLVVHQADKAGGLAGGVQQATSSQGLHKRTHGPVGRIFILKQPKHSQHDTLLYLFRTRKEGNVLFNDALNTFYLRLYGVRHMVKDHSHSEKGNPLPPHRLLFPISSKGSFICTIPQTG